MANKRISEKIKVRRIQPCGKANEIFLAWVNSRGGIDQFLFRADHAVARSTAKAIVIGKTVEEYETGVAFISMLKKDSIKELTLTAPQVDKQTRIGLEELFSSPKVLILKNGLNTAWDAVAGPDWQEVTVLDGRTDMGDTDDEVFDFPIRIELQQTKTLWA